MKTKTRKINISFTLDGPWAALVDALMVGNESMTTQTQLCRSACESGLIRLAMAGAESPLKVAAEACLTALREVPKERKEVASWARKIPA